MFTMTLAVELSMMARRYLRTTKGQLLLRTLEEQSLTHVSSQCPVGEAVSAFGQFVEFLLSKATDESDGLTTESVDGKVNAFSLLMQGAQERVHVLDRWRIKIPNKKLELKNHVIDWLEKKQARMEAFICQAAN